MSTLFMKLFNLTRNVANSSSNTKMVIIIRTDLGMGKGKIASNAAHAAVSLYNSASRVKHLWLLQGQPKVVLRVAHDCHNVLVDTYNKAAAHKINACKIFDAGRTQIDRGTLTAVGLGPDESHKIDMITKKFKLL